MIFKFFGKTGSKIYYFENFLSRHINLNNILSLTYPVIIVFKKTLKFIDVVEALEVALNIIVMRQLRVVALLEFTKIVF